MYIKVKPKKWFWENCILYKNELTYGEQHITIIIMDYCGEYIKISNDREFMTINNSYSNYFFREWIKEENTAEYNEDEYKKLYPEDFV